MALTDKMAAMYAAERDQWAAEDKPQGESVKTKLGDLLKKYGIPMAGIGLAAAIGEEKGGGLHGGVQFLGGYVEGLQKAKAARAAAEQEAQQQAEKRRMDMVQLLMPAAKDALNREEFTGAVASGGPLPALRYKSPEQVQAEAAKLMVLETMVKDKDPHMAAQGIKGMASHYRSPELAAIAEVIESATTEQERKVADTLQKFLNRIPGITGTEGVGEAYARNPQAFAPILSYLSAQAGRAQRQDLIDAQTDAAKANAERARRPSNATASGGGPTPTSVWSAAQRIAVARETQRQYETGAVGELSGDKPVLNPDSLRVGTVREYMRLQSELNPSLEAIPDDSFDIFGTGSPDTLGPE